MIASPAASSNVSFTTNLLGELVLIIFKLPNSNSTTHDFLPCVTTFFPIALLPNNAKSIAINIVVLPAPEAPQSKVNPLSPKSNSLSS